MHYSFANVIIVAMTIVKTMFVPGPVKGGHIRTRTKIYFIITVLQYVHIYRCAYVLVTFLFNRQANIVKSAFQMANFGIVYVASSVKKVATYVRTSFLELLRRESSWPWRSA